MDKPFPIPDDEYAAMGLESSDRPGRFQMPYLNVEFPSGRIVGHEGRHRSLMVHRQGGKTIPVTIYPREDTRVYAKLTFWDWSGGDEERPDIIQRIEFPSHKEAQSHIDQLEAEKKAASDRGEYGDIVFARGKVEFEGSNKLKGAPARTTDPWEPARWTREDFPEQLVGQYNPTVVVPKSQIKIGLVKGYRHFKD